MHIRDIMTTRVATVSMDDRLSVIKDIFEQAHFRHLLVLEEGELVTAVLSVADHWQQDLSQIPGLVELVTADLDAILTRERMGSTGIGNGIAIPHGKLEEDTLRAVGVFIRLEIKYIY